MVGALKSLAAAVSSKPLLRIYWYDGASMRSGPSPEHVRIAECDDVKLRLGFINAAGQQKGVDSLIVTDMVDLARNRAITDAVLLSGDEDVRVGVVLAQTYGVRMHLVAIHPGRGTQSHHLMQEADTWTEWDRHTVEQLISFRAEPERSSPETVSEIDGVARALALTLKDHERQGLIRYMQAHQNNIPGEFDGKLLARSRTALGRDLAPSEKTYARSRFRQSLAAPCG